VTAPRAIVLRAAGTNCDRETAAALELAGARVAPVHLRALQDGPAARAEAEILVLPGGFSYGDHLGAGRVLTLELGHRLRDRIDAHLARGGLLLGICNGFQVLVQMGLLPGGGRRATLAANAQGRFECRWVHLQTKGHPDSPYFDRDERLEFPVAHGEGRLLFDQETLLDGRVHLVYVDAPGRPGG
jgi:phosphoribosylformylglycinamidine synthase